MVALPAPQHPDGAVRPRPRPSGQHDLERRLQPGANLVAGAASARAHPRLAGSAARQILSSADAPPFLPLRLHSEGRLAVRALRPRAAGRAGAPPISCQERRFSPGRTVPGAAGEHRPVPAVVTTGGARIADRTGPAGRAAVRARRRTAPAPGRTTVAAE